MKAPSRTVQYHYDKRFNLNLTHDLTLSILIHKLRVKIHINSSTMSNHIKYCSENAFSKVSSLSNCWASWKLKTYCFRTKNDHHCLEGKHKKYYCSSRFSCLICIIVEPIFTGHLLQRLTRINYTFNQYRM